MIAGFVAAIALTAALSGCAHYTTPGRAASFSDLGITPERLRSEETSADPRDEQSDWFVIDRLDRKPLAEFPATVAVMHIQGSGYRSHSARGYGTGTVTVLSAREIEAETDFARLASMPMIRGIAPINRLIVPERITSEADLRKAAAAVQADMLLLYTFDTRFGVDDHFPPLSVITLGMSPNKQARVTSTAMAALLDTRNGFIYGLAEGTSQTTQLANAWTSSNAVDQSRRRAEREAFGKLIDEIEQMWQEVVRQHGPATGQLQHREEVVIVDPSA